MVRTNTVKITSSISLHNLRTIKIKLFYTKDKLIQKLKILVALNQKCYEGSNFNSGNYLFTTDTK